MTSPVSRPTPTLRPILRQLSWNTFGGPPDTRRFVADLAGTWRKAPGRGGIGMESPTRDPSAPSQYGGPKARDLDLAQKSPAPIGPCRPPDQRPLAAPTRW